MWVLPQIRDQTWDQLIVPGSETLKGYPNRVHGTHQPFGENEVKTLFETEFASPVRHTKGKSKHTLLQQWLCCFIEDATLLMGELLFIHHHKRR